MEQAISEIIRRRIEEKVLAPFLEARQKEVAEIREIHDYHIAEVARMESRRAVPEGAPKD